MAEIGCKLSREIKILPSMCGGNSELSIAAALDMFQDTATIHADLLGVGPWDMDSRSCFWIISKTRLHINRLPKMMEDVTSSTWIQPADRASCERDYSITSGDEVLAYGQSIWAVISRDTGKLVNLREIYPEHIEYDQESPDDRPFLKINKKFADAKPIGVYTVRSTDIDIGGHMNNVNYVRAMLGCLTSKQIGKMGISELEVHFISQTYEGETLRFVKRKAESGAVEIAALNSEDKAVFLAALF